MSPRLSSDRVGLALIVGCLLVLGMAAAGAALLQSRIPVHDPRTACVVGHPTSGHTLVLIDRTDPFTSAQSAAVRQQLHDLEGKLDPNELLSVWVVSHFPEGNLRRRFCRCFPGREANPLIQNPGSMAQRCDSLFSRPLGRLAASLPGPGAPRSPILEAICTLARTELGGSVPPIRLIIVSDLWQNSRSHSFYTGVPTFPIFQANPANSRLIADLRGVEIEILRVPRGGEDLAAELELLAFWEAYLTAAGASVVRIRRLT